MKTTTIFTQTPHGFLVAEGTSRLPRHDFVRLANEETPPELPGGTGPVPKSATDSIDADDKVKCPKCQQMFALVNEPEVSAGVVACPHCHEHLNGQDGTMLANESADAIELECCFANESVPDADGFCMLAPYGDKENVTPDGLKVIQRFQKKHAEVLKNEFDQAAKEEGAAFAGIPIYKGHPDRDGNIPRGKDSRKMGRTLKLDVRDDGLYGTRLMNEAGTKLVKSGQARFPSMNWFARPAGMDGGKLVMEPFEAISWGLTPKPNLPVKPLVNEAIREKYVVANAKDALGHGSEKLGEGRHGVLWGQPKGKSGALHEQPLVVTRSHPDKEPSKVIERVKELAGKDGFHSFRVADDGAVGSELQAPQFGKNLLANGGPGSGSWDGPGQPRFAAGKSEVAGIASEKANKSGDAHDHMLAGEAHGDAFKAHVDAYNSATTPEGKDAAGKIADEHHKSMVEHFDKANKIRKSLATGGSGGAKDIAKISKQYARNENNNFHSENAALLAHHFGTKEEQGVAAEHLQHIKDKGYGHPNATEFQAQMYRKYSKNLSNSEVEPGGTPATTQGARMDRLKLIALLATVGVTLANDADDAAIETALTEQFVKVKAADELKVTLTNETKAKEAAALDLKVATDKVTELTGKMDEAAKALVLVNEANVKVAGLEGEVTKLKDKITIAETTLANARDERAKTAGEASKLATDLTEARTTLGLKETALANERAEKGKLVTSLANAKTAIADLAVEFGKITPANRKTLEQALANDVEFAGLCDQLKKAQPIFKMAPILTNATNGTVDGATAESQYRTLINEAIEDSKKGGKKPLTQHAATLQVKASERGKALLALMHQPETGIPVVRQ